MQIDYALTDIWLPLAIAAIVQASFGLSVGVLTLLSGSSLSHESRRRKHGVIMTGYTLGSTVATMALLAVLAWAMGLFGWSKDKLVLMVLISALITAGLAVLLFYYRYDPKGTRLWLPRSWAKNIHHSAKKIENARASFLLGASLVIAELVFIAFPLSIAAYSVSQLSGAAYYAAILAYSLLAVIPLFILTVAYSQGAKVASIQRWRERNKSFLQISSGLLMITLGVYLLVYQI